MEILELIAEFRVMGVNPLPILLLYYFMNALRFNGLDKKLKKIKDIWYI
jgi:4-hydroxyphenylpyruvate dioxygenase-like putative hemolysin